MLLGLLSDKLKLEQFLFRIFRRKRVYQVTSRFPLMCLEFCWRLLFLFELNLKLLLKFLVITIQKILLQIVKLKMLRGLYQAGYRVIFEPNLGNRTK